MAKKPIPFTDKTAEPATPEPSAAPPYRPEGDLQEILNVINFLMPKMEENPTVRASLAERVSRHAQAIVANWPKAPAPAAPATK